MALRADATGEHAYAPNPWSGGGFTIAFWMYRLNSSSSSQFFTGLLDTDDATPETSADPRVRIAGGSGRIVSTHYFGNGGMTTDNSTLTYQAAGWSHVAIKVAGSGSTLTSIEVFIDGTGTGSPGTTSRDLSINGTMDRLQLGAVSANSNIDLAHWCFFNTELSGSQITELQTKLPSAITGATPVVYYPLLADGGNDGSGGGTYDLTLSSATIDTTNDGTLPSLSGGGGSTNLTVQDATHGHAADAVVLTTDQTLVVADALHAHSVDNLTISAAGGVDLIVSDALHAHSADTPTLTTEQVLVVADALHAHVVDALTLSTDDSIALVVNDATHGHLVDGVTLSTVSWLAVADALHAHLADKVDVEGGVIVTESGLTILLRRRRR